MSITTRVCSVEMRVKNGQAHDLLEKTTRHIFMKVSNKPGGYLKLDKQDLRDCLIGSRGKVREEIKELIEINKKTGDDIHLLIWY